MRKWKIRSSFSANLAIVCPVKSPKSTKNWRGDSSALALPRKSHEASVVASGAGHWRTDRRHIFSVKSCRFALKMKVGPDFQKRETTSPTQYAVVIACRQDCFCFRETAHGCF